MTTLYTNPKDLPVYSELKGYQIQFPLYKVLTQDFIHFNYQYHLGLNRLGANEAFIASKDKYEGGLYVTWNPRAWKHMGTYSILFAVTYLIRC
jgi:hypothetical protein